MEARDILIRPIITEKTTALMEEGKYTFRVPLAATKVDIRNAVEEVFHVKVNLSVWAVLRVAAAIGRRQL